MKPQKRSRGFTLIELLTVITILMMVAGLSLPGIIGMLEQKRWTDAIGNLQWMVMKARALATSYRRDIAVEFDVAALPADDDRATGEPEPTVMWLESENIEVERIPDLMVVQLETNGSVAIRTFMNEVFRPSGGNSTGFAYACHCTNCNHEWETLSNDGKCPRCGNLGRLSWWATPIRRVECYTEITWDSSRSDASRFGDNAHLTDDFILSETIVIDMNQSTDFVSWDAPTPDPNAQPYGKDEYPDIRIGTNGAMLQTKEPIICLKVAREKAQRRHVSVVRCTGRVFRLN